MNYELLGAVTQSGGLDMSKTVATLNSDPTKLRNDFINKNAQRIADIGTQRRWEEFKQLVADGWTFVNTTYNKGKNYLNTESVTRILDFQAAITGYGAILNSLGTSGPDQAAVQQKVSDFFRMVKEMGGWTQAAPATIATADKVAEINKTVDEMIAQGELDHPYILPSQKAQWMRLAYGNAGSPAAGWERDFRVQAVRSKYNADGTRKDGKPVDPKTVDAAYATVYRAFANAGLVMPEPKAGAPAEFVSAYQKAAATLPMPSTQYPTPTGGTSPTPPAASAAAAESAGVVEKNDMTIPVALAAVAAMYFATRG